MKNSTLRPVSGQLRWLGVLDGPQMVSDRVKRWEHYDAGQVPDLYIRFANLPLANDPEEQNRIQAFASKYGLLTVTFWETGDDEDKLRDSLSDWRLEILNMRMTLRLLEFSNSGKRKPLREAISWGKAGIFFVDKDLGKKRIARSADIVVKRLDPRRPLRTAIWAIAEWINQGLSGRTSAGVVVESTSKCEFTFLPSSRGVAGAVWSQLALAASRPVVRCLNCGEMFRPQRRTAKFCTTRRCRGDYHDRIRKNKS